MSKATRRDVEKERYWQKVIGEAATSGLSIRQFCREHRLREGQFHWWQHKLKERRQERTLGPRGGAKHGANGRATFAPVCEGLVEAAASFEIRLYSSGRPEVTGR